MDFVNSELKQGQRGLVVYKVILLDMAVCGGSIFNLICGYSGYFCICISIAGWHNVN